MPARISRIAAITGRTRHLLALAATLAVALLALPAGASAATNPIEGTVTGEGAGPLQGIRVCARPETSSFSSTCVLTGANGSYSITNLAEGLYRINFEGSGEWVGQWYAGVETEAEAADYEVDSGAIRIDADAELVKGATVEGTITDPGGTGLGQIRACVNLADGDPSGNFCATSESSGHYRIVGIPAGEYKLRLERMSLTSDYLTQYWPGGRSFAEGTTIGLAKGATKAGVDATMQLGGTISGKVVNESGEPLKGLFVCTYPVLADTNFSACSSTTAETASDGTYTLHGLYSGEYKVAIRPGFGAGNYLPSWFDGQPTRRGATAVTVTAPTAVTGIDSTLAHGGVIAGTVREAGSHTPLSFFSVCAYYVGSHSSHCAQTKADGSYRIESLPTGEYTVEFGSPNNSTDWAYVPVTSAPVAVTVGEEAGGVSAELEKGGTISGRVTDAVSHAAAKGVEVCAGPQEVINGHCDTTDSAGEYTLIGLPAGSYALEFVPAQGGPFQNFQIGNQHYTDQWYSGAASEATATLVESGPGMAVTGKDVEMHEGGGISGTVTGPLGVPLREADACITASAEDLGSHCARTDGSGNYEIEGLNPGSYTVHFIAPGNQQHVLAPQYFHGAEDFAGATPVQVNGTAVTPAIDAELVDDGSVEGWVTDSFDHGPVAGTSVCAETGGGQIINCDESRADGHYEIPLPPGSYKIKFALGYYEEELGPALEVEEFTTQWFDGASTAAASTPVTVTSGAATNEIDAVLDSAEARSDTVSVARVGDGSGFVTSEPAGIDCGRTCSSSFETRKTVTLTAEPQPGSVFTGWTGACSGTGSCQVRLTGEVEAAATFQQVSGGGTSTAIGTVTTTSTATPGNQQTGQSRPKPKKSCKKGFAWKKVGKLERCVKKKPKHHPAKHRAARH